ncbi:hypothetical protein SMG44B_40142 [Stenotrophomonas maltophilia]
MCGRIRGVGPAEGLRRGRRESIPGGSVAPSMALTPLRNPSVGPRTVFVRHRGMKKQERERSRAARALDAGPVELSHARLLSIPLAWSRAWARLYSCVGLSGRERA